MKINLQTKSELHVSNLHQAFSNLIGQDEKVNIVAKTGTVGSISCNLLRFFSPVVNDLLNDIPCCIKLVIIMPDVCNTSVDHVINIIGSGFTNNKFMSSKQIQDVEEIGKMLQIDMIGLKTNNVNSIEKATENLKDVPEESSLTGVKEDSKITGI